MLDNIRRRRRLHTVVLTVFALLWLVSMLSGARVRAMPLPGPLHDGMVMLDSMQHSLCVSDAGQAASGAEYAAWLDEVLNAPVSTPDAAEHSGHEGPHCLLCIGLMGPPAFALQVVPYPVPAEGLAWKQPAHFPPALQISAPLPPRGPPVTFRV